MSNRDLVYESLSFIEEELKSDLNVFSLSRRFGFSHYYFSRLFKGVTGQTLQEYILARKITDSCSSILSSDRTILDIALEYGFSSHESYSRAFRRILGINPSELKREGKLDELELKTVRPLTPGKLESLRRNSNQLPEKIKRNEIHLAGIPFYYDLSMKNDLSRPWANLTSNLTLIERRIVPERYYQVQFWFPDQDAELVYFFIAVEVESPGGIPFQFSEKTIPAHTYLQFRHRGRSNLVGNTYQYIYGDFLPDSDYRFPHLFNFECYGEEYKGPYNEDSVSEIYIPVEDGDGV